MEETTKIADLAGTVEDLSMSLNIVWVLLN